MRKKRMVIALGHKDLGTTLPEQRKAVRRTAQLITFFVRKGFQIALTFSNAPQAGMIYTAMKDLSEHYPEQYTRVPLALCSAMSQGLIGYDLQNAVHTELLKHGIYKTVSTVLTQVQVDPYDESFYHPAKLIGREMDAAEAEAEEEAGNHMAEVSPGRFRRIVPAPVPEAVIEIEAVRGRLDLDQIVICCGGGGIPVMRQGTELRGAAAVIEKDLTAGLLAEEIDADLLLITTAVEHVSLDFGKPGERAVGQMSVREAKEYLARGEFEFRSMQPKVEAAVRFIEGGKDRETIITTMEAAEKAFLGLTGTHIR